MKTNRTMSERMLRTLSVILYSWLYAVTGLLAHQNPNDGEFLVLFATATVAALSRLVAEFGRHNRMRLDGTAEVSKPGEGRNLSGL